MVSTWQERSCELAALLPMIPSANMRLADFHDSTAAETGNCRLCPLSRVRAGMAVRIKRLCAAPEVSQRLREIGFGEEQIIKLLTAQTNVICLVCNTRLAISAQLARIILVEPIGPLAAT